ncbi:MAG: lipopolysaccharide assembly protein LapA domain-containing protein [bacterium]
MKKGLYVLLVAALALFGLTFSYKNHQIVAIDYYFGLRFQTELVLLLFAVFAAGLAFGYLAALPGALNARRKRRRAEREHAQAQTDAKRERAQAGREIGRMQYIERDAERATP